MNTGDFRTSTTARVPKKASNSYLDALGQHNAAQAKQDRAGDPNDLGSTALIPDNNSRRPENNEPIQEMNTDDFRTPTTMVRVPKKARKRYLDGFGQHNADQAHQDRVGDSSDFGPTVLISDKYNDRPKNNRPIYDADLLMRRIILSNDVRRTPLVKHDEGLNESNTAKDIEDDETFFENLKKRIKEDLQKNILQKTPKPLPKRLPKARKCKGLLTNETRNLMNKFREEFARSQSQKTMSQENGVFSLERRSNSSTREEHAHSAMSQSAVERAMTKNIMSERHETDGDLLRVTPSFRKIHAEEYKHQSIPSSSNRNVAPPMKRRGNSWSGENICKHRHSVMAQKVVERRMSKDIRMKDFMTDNDALSGRSPFDENHTEAHNRQPTSSSSEWKVAPSMKRRGDSWTGENIYEHRHPVMPQKDIAMKYFETDKDSYRGRSPFNEIHVETRNCQPTSSPSERRAPFSIERRSGSWHCETNEDSLCNTLPCNEIDAQDYNRQPTPSSERNWTFFMEPQSNNSTRESIREHSHLAMAQNLVERGPTKDIMFEYFETDKDSVRGTPSFNEIHTEAYDRQPTSSSPGSDNFVKYYTMKYC